MLSGVLGNRNRLSCESRWTLMTPSRIRRLIHEVETCRDCATSAMVNHPEMWRARIDLASCSTRCRCRMTRYRTCWHMAASRRAVPLLCQYCGDRGIVNALSREFKQAGLHFLAPRERRHGMHAGFNLQL